MLIGQSIFFVFKKKKSFSEQRRMEFFIQESIGSRMVGICITFLKKRQEFLDYLKYQKMFLRG
jgi:hypothetical protein